MRAFILLFGLQISFIANAEIAAEALRTETFHGAGAHGVLVNSFANRAVIYDADTGEMKGLLSLGIGHNAVEIDLKNKLFHVAETYFSRHTRGIRSDVVTSYDFKTLSAVSEVAIPNKHSSGSPIQSYTGLTDDSKFMLVNNFSPVMSVSVVDLEKSKFVGEIATSGCGLVYPIGNRAFVQLCGDGKALLVSLDDNGNELSRVRSEGFFSVYEDPIMEKAVRTSNGWIFSTFTGKLFRVTVEEMSITIEPLFELAGKATGWRPGGMQPFAYHESGDLLLALMHEGGEHTHKDPGSEIWILDLTGQRLMHRMKLDNMASSIAVSQDESPLIYSVFVGGSTLDVYDLVEAKKIRSIYVGPTPTILQNLQL